MRSYYTAVHSYGNHILYRGIENGKPVRKRVGYAPTLFVPCQNESEYKTVRGENVAPMKFDSIREARKFSQSYDGVSGMKIYGNSKYEYTFIGDHFPEMIDWNLADINIVPLDIEVESENGFPEPDRADEKICAITLRMYNQIYSMGLGAFDSPENVNYQKFDDESRMLLHFLDIWTRNYPDIVTGWNVEGFDIKYLHNRIKKILGDEYAKKLSPWGVISEKTTYMMGTEKIHYSLLGIAILDYKDLYKKFAPNGKSQESYTLKNIADVELGDTKIDYVEDHGTLQNLYKMDFQKFMTYNIKDMTLIDGLEDKLRLIELALTLAYDSKSNFEDVFKQVRMWDAIIFNHLKRKKIVVPPIEEKSKNNAFEGAYVKEPVPGLYSWTVSFDLNSLYPHLIMQYNISPDTFLEPSQYGSHSRDLLRREKISIQSLINKENAIQDDLEKDGVTMTPNKQFFAVQKQGFLAEIMEDMYINRSAFKKKMIECEKQLQITTDSDEREKLEKLISRYDNLQLAKKVSLNSAYGALGSAYFRFFDTRQAEAITLAGQLSIQWIENRMNQYMNNLLKTENVDYVIASDTDSIYLSLAGLVERLFDRETQTKDPAAIVSFLDKFCEDRLQKFINDCYLDLAQYLNAYSQKMEMKREVICDKGLWTAKKRYILSIWNKEGVAYSQPQIKIKGLEAIKSSTPKACRVKIKEAIKIILTKTNDDIIQFIDEFRIEFKQKPLMEIARPSSVNGLVEYWDTKLRAYKLRAPMHVKGSLLYNRLLEDLKIERKYERIKEGEKIKFLYLKEPNPFHTNVIAFINILPEEFNIEKYIDYDQQYEKTFVDPLKIILNSIGWKTEHIATLEEFFK